MSTNPITLGQTIARGRDNLHCERLRETAKSFANFCGWPGDCCDIPVDLLFERSIAFRHHLRRSSNSESGVKKYADQIPFLISCAKKLGWTPDSTLSSEWKALLEDAQKRTCIDLVRYFARKNLEPRDITHALVEAWVDERTINRDRTFVAAYLTAISFEQLLVGYKYLSAGSKQDHFGIPLDQFQSPLKEEVNELIAYRKSNPRSWGENNDNDDWEIENHEYDEIPISRRRQLRGSTAEKFASIICYFYGYQIKHRGRRDVTCLRRLFRPKAIDKFRIYLVNSGNTVRSVANVIKALIAAALQHPLLASYREGYEMVLIKLEEETIDEQRARRISRTHRVTYDELEKIPAKIHEEGLDLKRRRLSGVAKLGYYAADRIAIASARLAMKEFMMRWLLLLPWKSQSICQCRCAGNTPNLFKKPVKLYKDLHLPSWATQMKADDDDVELWQYRFDTNETWNGAFIHAVLPRDLISPLEAYLKSRKQLVKKRSTETLFVNSYGDPLQPRTFGFLITEIALIYAGKRVSPSAVRDIFAYEYLQICPEDFPSLALLLWHQDPETTKELYGISK